MAHEPDARMPGAHGLDVRRTDAVAGPDAATEPPCSAAALLVERDVDSQRDPAPALQCERRRREPGLFSDGASVGSGPRAQHRYRERRPLRLALALPGPTV